MDQLVYMVENEDRYQNALQVTVKRNIAWTLSNLCRGKPPIRLERVKQVVPALLAYTHSKGL